MKKLGLLVSVLSVSIFVAAFDLSVAHAINDPMTNDHESDSAPVAPDFTRGRSAAIAPNAVESVANASSENTITISRARLRAFLSKKSGGSVEILDVMKLESVGPRARTRLRGGLGMTRQSAFANADTAAAPAATTYKINVLISGQHYVQCELSLIPEESKFIVSDCRSQTRAVQGAEGTYSEIGLPDSQTRRGQQP